MVIYFLLSIVFIQIGAVTACMFIAWKQEMLHWFLVFVVLTLLSICEFVILYTRHLT